MNPRFDAAMADKWLDELTAELHLSDPDQARAALRAGLHALRDRLTVKEAGHLAAQMPLGIRGVFFEGWRASPRPAKVRRREDYVALVAAHLPEAFKPRAAEMARAVFNILRRHLSAVMIENVEAALPKPVVEVLEQLPS